MLPGKKGNALILGTGGASKAVAYVLKHLQINFRYVSRKPADNTVLSYDEISAHIMKNFTILINTTPLGTFPDIMHVPSIPYQEITENHILIDLIYNPDKTQFLQNGENKGAKISNGLKMLKLQAEQAWKIWNHLPINSDI